tara:strand:+ start:1572 stop:2012 length:441 start_codon:yes stop_codon:yes gene_type:complete
MHTTKDQEGIGLTQFIETVETELHHYQSDHETEEAFLHLKKCTLEVKVAACTDARGGMSIRVADARENLSAENTHTVRLRFEKVNDLEGLIKEATGNLIQKKFAERGKALSQDEKRAIEDFTRILSHGVQPKEPAFEDPMSSREIG